MKRLSHGQLASLVRRAGLGDQEAFAILYAATVENQLYFATAFLKDASLAEDVVQEVYLSLFRSLGHLENPKLFVAYLNRICYNACIAQLKKISRRADEPDEETLSCTADKVVENNPAECYAALERNSELLSALSGLPDQHKAAFLMRHYHEMKIRDIALSMDCSESTVKRYISAAMRQLRTKLGGERFPERENVQMILPLFKFSPIYKLLRQSAELTAPEPETFQHMLDMVMQASQSAEAKSVSFSAALSGANSLVKKTRLSQTVAAVATAATVTVATAVGVSVSPSVTDLRLEASEGFVRQAEAVIVTQNTMPFASVRLVSDGGGTIVASRGQDGHYLALITQNGNYIVEVANPNGKTAFSSLEIDCIDSIIPAMNGFSSDENYIYINFTDSQSGVDWGSVYAVKQDGTKLAPIRTQLKEGIAVFAYPDSDIDVFIEDNAGNKAKTAVHVQQEK